MDYRLTIYPALEIRPQSCVTFYFDTQDELDTSAISCGDLLLFMQDEAQIMPDYSNMFVKEEKIDDEWYAIED